MEDPLPYEPKPIDNSTVELSPELNELTETLARNNHELWAKRRMAARRYNWLRISTRM